MLGEKLGEMQGKITSQRVLQSDGPAPKVETSFEISGTMVGTEATMMATYWSTVMPDGSLYGECPRQGVIMTKEGEMGTWSGTGAGRFTGRGSGVSFRGVVYFQTTSQKLARLNGTAVVYEWEVDEDGNGQASFFEWK